jgi:methylated-DNA-[protein]-cysteine S-methyltransferase
MTTTLDAPVCAHHASPLGTLLLVGERAPDGDTVLTGCYFPDHRRGPAVDPAWSEDPAAFAAIEAALEVALAGAWAGALAGRSAGAPDPNGPRASGGSQAVTEIPVAFRGGTPFQQRVWEELRTIPRGQTVAYGELAARLGMPGAARAVGSAVARNPISIVVPCHRVVAADGSLAGYAGGVERKRALLALEGAISSGRGASRR